MAPYDDDDDVRVDDLIDEALGESPDIEDRLYTDSIAEQLEAGAENAEGGGGDGPNLAEMLRNVQEPTYAQPVSRATMVCLRGPCVHYWALTARLPAPGRDIIRLTRFRMCNCSPVEETNLGGQNIYHCTAWWPLWLEWVPRSLRNVLRPKLIAIYEKVLPKMGYDLAWKTWPDWLFESDHPKFRAHQGLGAPRPDRRNLEVD